MRLAMREVLTAFSRAPGLGILSVFTVAFFAVCIRAVWIGCV